MIEKTYLIPREGRDQQAYYDHVTALPWEGAPDSFIIDPSAELVTSAGSLTGYTEILPIIEV